MTPANTPDRDAVEDLLTEPAPSTDTTSTDTTDGDTTGDSETGDGETGDSEAGGVGLQVFVDSAYADGATVQKLSDAGHDLFTMVPLVRNVNGFSKDRFHIEPDAGTITCPARHTVPIRTNAVAGKPASANAAPAARCARPAPSPAPAG